MGLPDSHRDAVYTIATKLRGRSIDWALTGSTSFALQGVPIAPDDIDVQSTEKGAYQIEEQFPNSIIQPVEFSESQNIRSHFGVLALVGVRVEIMGAVQKRGEDGTWDRPVDIQKYRKFVTLNGVRIPVLSLRYEAEAYEKLGRTKRAEFLRENL